MRIAGLLFLISVFTLPAYADDTKIEPYYPGYEFKASDGSVLIEDGDSFWIGIHRVRLMGIDTLEPNQPCEASSQSVDCHAMTMQYVEPLFHDPSLVCKLHMGKQGKPLMQGGRYITTCFVGGEELNRLLISEGYAVAYEPKTSKVYEDVERAARFQKKGLFKYNFQDPIEFRRRGKTIACR